MKALQLLAFQREKKLWRRTRGMSTKSSFFASQLDDELAAACVVAMPEKKFLSDIQKTKFEN